MTQNKDNFVHTHVHTRYSMLDGLSKLDELMQKVAEEGQPAVAITDHGNMFGAYDAYKTSKKFGVKAIIGSEFYLAPGDTSRRTRERIRWGSGGGDDVSGGGAFTHATLLAENNQGMHNLFKLSSESFVSGLYYKPRIDRELLSQHSKGIIATTGCPSGEVQTRLRLGQFDEALEAAATYRDIFGQDNYFVEIMDHGLSIEQITRDGLLVIAKRLNLPLLATNDLHYVSRTDAPAHEAMLCVQSGAKLADPNRFKFDAEEFYLKTADEMRTLFSDRPDACDNTLLVAERCNVSFNEGADLMPRFPVPEGETLNSWLEKEIQIGLERRYPNGIPQDRIELARYETEVICSMGFAGYFLVVADYIVWAKKNKIRVGPGRGCLHGDSNILCKDGIKKISEISINDEVMDQNGTFVKPVGVHKYECAEDLIGILAENCEITYFTDDHKILVKRHGQDEPVWIPASTITTQDFVCRPDWQNEYSFYKVLKISTHYSTNKPEDRYVYDITIPTTSSYVAGGFIVHNSAAGSLVAYALGITEIDPVVHGLIFERFLNPERVSMPDIDVDFDDTRRGEVIQYVTEKYGADKVAQIVTFGMVKAKAAVKDAARILGEPFVVGEKITKLVPAPIVGKDMSLHGIFDPDHERYKEGADMRALYQKDATVKKVIDTAMGLEGATRQWGVHAAGVILSAEPLTDHIPVLKRESDGAIITQFDQKTCETLGLLKMDFLGLRNLTVIEETLDLIEKNTGIRIIPEDIPYDDHKTFHLVAQGETLGVFQLDSGPMRALLRSMQPDHFEDISAVLALYRPGPMGANAHNDYADRKNKRKPSKPIHPELAEALEEILGPTYGLIVYQEQVQKIAQKLAGYTLGEADLFRRAMGKKDAKELQGQFGKFSSGMKDNGYSEASIKTLWDILLPFSDYAFNKAHTAAYGTISYWTAYFKANYPTEYMAALLSSVQSDKDKTAIYVNECRRMGLSILPPDVNESGAHYTPVSHGIRIGLGAIRNVGVNVINAIIDTREEQGAFVSFTDFLDKVPASACNKRTVDSLIKAGAFSLLHDNRAALSFAHAEAIDVYVASKKSKMKGQEDIFASFAEETGGDHSALYNLPTIPEWDRLTLLGHEREMLGQYVTDHPLRGYQKSVSEKADGSVAFLFPPGGLPRQRRLTKIAGIITTIQSKKTKKGDAYAIFSLEDTTGAVEVTILPGKFAEFQDLIHSDSLVTLTANPDFREDGSYVLLLQSIAQADFARDPEGWVAGDDGNTVKIINITVTEEKVTPRFVKVIKEIFEDSPGKIEVYMTVISSSSGLLKYKLPFSVKPEIVLPQLKGLLGDDKVTLI